MNRREFVSKAMTAVVVGTHASAQTLLAATPASDEENHILSSETMRIALAADGTIRWMEMKSEGRWEPVDFCKGAPAGPAWAAIKMQRQADSRESFAATADGVRYTLRYQFDGSRLVILAGLKNQSGRKFVPPSVRMVLGINCEMLFYPDWNNRYFPTLLRCEKTHFWGYFMTPRGRILAVGSPDPVASYTMDYEKSSWGDGGHLIKTCALDLMHALPLPVRHPQNLTSLDIGEERTWKIYLEPLSSLEEVKPALAAALSAPMIEADRYTLAPGETTQLTVWANQSINAAVTDADGSTRPLPLHSQSTGRFAASFTPGDRPGLYRLTVTQHDGHVSEATIAVRRPWSWYLGRAREAALFNKQYASSHLEQWLGLESGAMAHRYLPDASQDEQIDQRLRQILALQWDLQAKRPTNMLELRYLVNTAQMASVTAHRYLADKDPYWLDLASGFADYVISRQAPDGRYQNYTTVAYPVKCVMTVMAIEKSLAPVDARYAAAYDRHYTSAKKAMDFLVRVQDDLTTEGQNTFEDGMISCAGMQLGLFALLQTDPDQRRVYADAARRMMQAHKCLEQLLIPDARMNGATLRFWEAQYDVLIGGDLNMMNSPHGWTAWLIPGLWYQYLLTGEEEWLRKAMNTMGSCAQLVDAQSGELRWGFVPDPYREVTMLVADSAHPGEGRRVPAILGEQYVPMIASFHYPAHEPVFGNGWTNGWTCCNDVHETFVALCEVALTACYVLERADGALVAWNGVAHRDSYGVIHIQPAEDVVTRVHVNLRAPRQVNAVFAGGSVSERVQGLQWMGPGGVPELFSSTV